MRRCTRRRAEEDPEARTRRKCDRGDYKYRRMAAHEKQADHGGDGEPDQSRPRAVAAENG